METNEEKKDVEVKSAENVEKVGTVEKKKGIKVLWLILAIVVGVILIIAAYQGISWLVSPERKHQADIATYMQDKYSEEFKVKFVEKRMGAEYVNSSCDASYFTYMNGLDENVTEYLYQVVPVSNSKLVSYAVYAENKATGEHQIYETTSRSRSICGDPAASDSSVYETNATCYQEKQELKGQLEYYLGSGYDVDYDSSVRYIIVETNKNLEMFAETDWVGFEQLYNNLVKLLEGKEVQIRMLYVDRSLTLSKESTFTGDYTVQELKREIEEKQWN